MTRSRMEGSSCIPLAMGRGAGCREEKMASGLKARRWKRENERKGGRLSKGIESTRDEEMRMEACKMALAHNDVNSRAGASNARKGREMAFGEEVGVVVRARGLAQENHLHRGEQRWTLDERPLKERKVGDRNGNNNNRKDVQRDIATHPTQRSQTTSAGTYLISIAEQTGEPHPSPILYSSPAYLTVSRSSTHSGPVTNRRANRHRDAFTRLRCVISRIVSQSARAHTCVV